MIMAVSLKLMLLAIAGIALTGCGASEKEPPSPPPAVAVPAPKPVAVIATDSRPVVAAFGDSLSAGLGLDPGQSFPDDLQQLVDAAGYSYRIVNLGVSGDTTTDGVERLPSVLALKPAVVILEDGYPLDSGDPYRLWSSLYSFRRWVNNQIVSNRADDDRLLREAKKELPAALGFSAVEAEGKFIQIVVKVLVTDGALMRSHEPAFEQGENAVDAGQQFGSREPTPFYDGHLMHVSAGAYSVVSAPAIGMDPASRCDRFGEK
jgi:hypothetical protein